ncbi:MAG: 3-phosphoserine/phosphohydroxythreonine transaminase [Aureliella sp.]
MATQVASERVYNFSAGPAVLPVPVLEQIRDEMLCLPGAGASVMELSHRSKAFVAIQQDAKDRISRLLGVGDNHEVLFLQGGSRLQFSMIPMNLLRGQATPAQYILTGSWGKNALSEAKKEGDVEVVYDAAESNYDHVPDVATLPIRDDAAYLHVTSNETIQGVQIHEDLQVAPPLVCDVSSDFLHRSYDIERYGLLYACAQKNAGPAGVTVVVVRKDLLARSSSELPGYMNYNSHVGADSMWNTPPTFAVYVLGLVAKWIEDTMGGLDKMHAHNKTKSQLLYDVVDEFPAMYIGHARKEHRSLMNVTFRLPSDELQAEFLAAASAANLETLKGHRSVGGIRASVYNAMPIEGVKALASLMRDFASKRA